MGAYSGPNVVDDSLVFYYDTFNQLKSYKGEPTTNLTTDTPSLNGWQGSYTVVNSSTKTFLITTQQNTASVGSAWRTFYWSVSSYIGSYITISADVEFVSETNCTFSSITIGQGNTGQYPYHLLGSPAADRQTVDTKPVEKIHMTWSGVINATGIVGFTQWIGNTTVDGANAVLRISNVQIEAKAHETPFVNGTRSATQGLLDLTGNNSISLASVSFDSDAQITFDGTDDTIDTGLPLTDFPALSDFTIEAIVKIDAYPTATSPNYYGNTYRCGVIVGATYYCGTALYWYGNTSGNACTVYGFIRGNDAYITAGGYSLVPGGYHHLVLVNKYSSSTISLYADGALNGSTATATQEYNSGLAASAGNIGIAKAQVDGGGTAVYSYLPMDAPVVKLYNRALTASEVQSNYQAIRTRYGI